MYQFADDKIYSIELFTDYKSLQMYQFLDGGNL